MQTADFLPSFATLSWFQKNVKISPKALRILNEAIAKKRRGAPADPRFFGAWPRTRVKMEDVASVLWNCAKVPRAFTDIAKLHREVNHSRRLTEATLFEPIRVQAIDHPVERADDEFYAQLVFCDFLEARTYIVDGITAVERNRKITQKSGRPVGPITQEVINWIEGQITDDERDASLRKQLGHSQSGPLSDEEKACVDWAATARAAARIAETEPETFLTDFEMQSSAVRTGLENIAEMAAAYNRPQDVSCLFQGLSEILSGLKIKPPVSVVLPGNPICLSRTRVAEVKSTIEQIEDALTKAVDVRRKVFENIRSLDDTTGVDTLRSLAETAEEAETNIRTIACRIGELLAAIVQEAAQITSETGSLAQTDQASSDPEAKSDDRLAVLEQLLVEAETERDAVRKSLAASEAANNELRTKLKSLEMKLRDARPLGSGKNDGIPTTLKAIGAWIQAEAGPHLEVLPKALAELRRNPTANLRRLAEGLLFLRDVYIPMRHGKISTEEYQQALRKARFTEEPSLANMDNAKHFSGYQARWRARTVVLDHHLRWGKGRGVTNAFRIYFHFDEATGAVVVGHMPTHLDNFMSS